MNFHKAVFFLLQTLFKSKKICYNTIMNNQRGQKNSGGFFASLIGEQTHAKTAGLSYTVAALAIFAVSFIIGCIPIGEGEQPQWWLYLGFLAAPTAFLIVGIWYFSYTKSSFIGFVKQQKCHPKYYLIALLLQVGLFGLSELNVLFVEFLQSLGYKDAGITLPSLEGAGFIGVFITIAIIPAIMEEFVFRGVFLRETKEFSLPAQVLICGGLFALYHQNPAQTVYQFICGAAFAFVAIKSGSILPTMLSHFINNAVILTLTKLGIESFDMPMYAIILVVSGLCLVGALVYLLVFDSEKAEKKKGDYGQLFACAGMGIFMLLLSWAATLLTGF